MPTCDYCNATYRGWAIKDGRYRYCTGLCQERGRTLLNVLKTIPESEIERVIIDAHQSICPNCNKNSGIDVHSSYEIWSAIVYSSWKTNSHIVCKACARKMRLKALISCLVKGWWSPPGLLTTPFYALFNVIAFITPTHSSASERFRKLVRINLARRQAAQQDFKRH